MNVAALDALAANVMIADNDLNIVYMNKAIVTLLRDAQGQLKRELPNFNVDTLIGGNIDVFHKTPSHQRGMLSSLAQPHRALIRVGARAFDLLITPLTVKGRREGFAVEWSDAAPRLLNLDYATKMTAVGRTQAIIEFLPDGTIIEANENFLKALGYEMHEIKGRPHSIFVEAGYRDSAEYVEFWNTLRNGRCQSAQFKRIGKNGRTVWIEGSYNPILDEAGKVTKVVKFAIDITGQMTLLADLKTLVDRNFRDIDEVMEQSASRAASASAASGEASITVQTLADSANELAASVSEIAGSMANSRIATEQASSQADEVSASTGRLMAAADAMSGIVGLIQNIAGQINLLALNATIEAARAGDAGRGFAVVASEVKNLASQAARATDQISAEIGGIQAASSAVGSGLAAIRDAVGTVRENVTITASAVEEQSIVTQGMSDNMRSAAGLVSSISGDATDIASSVQQALLAISTTKQAAQVLVR